MRGTVELVTSASTGTFEETFTGRAAGRGSGTLHLAESFTLDTTENLATHTRIVGGSGDFAGSRGRVEFAGQMISIAPGSGIDEGRWARPDDPT